MHLGHDQIVPQRAVLDGQPVEAAPVAAGLHECQAHPGFPLQAGHAVHGACAQVAGLEHAAQHVAHGAQRLAAGLVQERGHFFGVTGHQQEAAAALRKAADFAAVVRRLGHGVAIGAQQGHDLVQQVPATRGDARHVFENHQLGRVIAPGLQHQPHAAQRQAVEGLVLVGLALALGQQAAESLAGRGQKHDVRAFAASCSLNIRGCGFLPVRWRLGAVEGAVLLAVEQIQHGAGHAGQAAEVADAGRVHVDAAQAAEFRLQVAHARARTVEAARAAAQAAEQMEVADFHGGGGSHGHAPLLASASMVDQLPSSGMLWPAQWGVPRLMGAAGAWGAVSRACVISHVTTSISSRPVTSMASGQSSGLLRSGSSATRWHTFAAMALASKAGTGIRFM
jgi:hypothetical protein